MFDTYLLFAGSQHGESHPWQQSWGKGGLSGPPGLSQASTPKTRVWLPYCIMLSTYLLTLQGGYPPLPFSGKCWLRAPVNSLLHIKGLSQLKPLWWLSNLPDRFTQIFTTTHVIVYSPPTTRGTKLKASYRAPF